MTHMKPGFLIISCTAILVLLSASACRTGDRHPESDRVVWFVQLTDPHLFLDTSRDADAVKKATREKQEKLDQDALADVWKQIPSLSHGDRPLSFLAATGDFGVEPCSIADIPASATSPAKPSAKDCLDKVNKDKRSTQITMLAEELGASPVRDIYLVPGNNDIAFETATDDGLAYFNQLIDEVQKKIDDSKKNVQLHNLTRCYLSNGAASTCYVDIPDTPYRLLGFPSYSFKNREPGFDSNTPLQEKQFEIFRGLLDQARQSGKKVLILSHTPLIDDPYTMAQDRYAGIKPPAAVDKDANNPRSVWSVWNVSKKLADEWQEAVASDSVVGVLAGHLHDSHREIYQRPYLWSTVNDLKTGFSKLYLAPPVSVKNQDTSPIQARGISLVGLGPDGISYETYWYNAERGDFTPTGRDEYARRKWGHRDSTWGVIKAGAGRIIGCVWQFLCPTSLDQSAILFIALLAAFLTVVRIWQIPAPDNPLLGAAPPSKAATDSSAGGAQAGEAKPAFEPSPFASNLGKTVIAGLGGLAAETVLKSLEGKPSAGDKEFYIVWFVILFFTLLVLTAVLRGAAEAMRARVAIIHYALARPGGTVADGRWKLLKLFWSWLTYWLARFVHWLFSLRVPLLTFLDTFINLIQGKNQTLTQVFSDKIIEQQRNVVRVADTLRRQLNEVILLHLNNATSPPQPINPEDVRVNISVLSADQSSVFYIARTPGSAVQGFMKRSVAWVSVFTGKIRWYKHSYKNEQLHPGLFSKIVLFDNQNGRISGDEPLIGLQSHYQPRDDDYEAFAMFPVPWPQRGYGSEYVKGAIHISFRHESYFDVIFPIPTSGDPVIDSQTYKSEERMLEEWCPDAQIRATLRDTIVILGELLRGFNENIYRASGGLGLS